MDEDDFDIDSDDFYGDGADEPDYGFDDQEIPDEFDPYAGC